MEVKVDVFGFKYYHTYGQLYQEMNFPLKNRIKNNHIKATDYSTNGI